MEPKRLFHFSTGLRGDDGRAQGKIGGASRPGGTNRVGRRVGREWTVALRSGGTWTTSRGYP